MSILTLVKMEVFEAIKKRKSIRKFLDKEVPDDMLDKIIEAASLAPSGMNQQPWEFVVVKDKKTKKEIRELYSEARKKLNLYEQDTTFVENACQIFVCYDKKKLAPLISCALAIENMLIAATALGLGSIIMTAPVMLKESADKIKAILKVPEGYEIMALVLVGYADEDPERKPRRNPEEIKHVDCF